MNQQGLLLAFALAPLIFDLLLVPARADFTAATWRRFLEANWPSENGDRTMEGDLTLCTSWNLYKWIYITVAGLEQPC